MFGEVYSLWRRFLAVSLEPLSLSLSLSLAPEWMGGMSRVGLLFRPHQWKLPSAQRELEAPNAIALPSKLSAKCENQEEREREKGEEVESQFWQRSLALPLPR